MRDALKQQAGFNIPGDDRRAVRTLREGPFLGIEPQPDLAAAFVRTVTEKAIVRQNRPNIALKIDGGRSSSLTGRNCRDRQGQDPQLKGTSSYRHRAHATQHISVLIHQ